ncbi:MAG: peroxiredoxin [Bacteriovoracales bacterium]|jgi:thioredoxin-dependent peroxiredoxin
MKILLLFLFTFSLRATDLHLGDQVPDFDSQTTLGKINFYKWLDGKWAVMFSHPKAFTPVCTTELGVLALLNKDFSERNTKIIALSIDNEESQKNWVKDINEKQNSPITFPIISDEKGLVGELFGMIRPGDKDLNVRSVYIISPDKKVKLILTYPATTGRNFNEILRVLDSLQLVEKKKVATPANWNPGDQVVIPKDVSDKEADKKYLGKVTRIHPYLRMVDQPKI